MKFSIIIKGRSWCFQLADSFNKLKSLDSLVTTYPKFMTRKYKIPNNKVKSIIFIEIIQRIGRQFLFPLLKKLKINYDPMSFVHWFSDYIFSLFYVKNCEFLLIGFGSSCKKIIAKAKKKNIKTIYFLNSSSDGFQKVVEDEYYKLGISQHYYKPSKIFRDRINESIKSADFVAALSSYQKKTYIDDGFDESNMFISHLGVDPDVFYPKNIIKSKFIVLTNGHNPIRKGSKYLIEGFNSLNLTNAELWLAGHSIKDKELLDKITKIEKNNIFIPSMSEFDLPNLYNKASIFCLPSFEEGLPTVIPQAMACALPIISTCFVSDIINDNEEGFIINAGSSNEISKKIKFFYDNPDKVVEMGNKARIKAINTVSFDAVARRITSFCNNMKSN
jgi:glycosyltransferase involved in cell wall biosynthesis